MKGFIPKFYRDGQPDGYITLPCAAGAYQIGQALAIAAGKLVVLVDAAPLEVALKLKVADPTTGAKYISMYEGTVGDGDVIPVIAVDCSTEYEVVLEAAVGGLVPGVVCVIASGGMGIGGVASDGKGALRVISCTGAAIGDTAVVQFI